MRSILAIAVIGLGLACAGHEATPRPIAEELQQHVVAPAQAVSAPVPEETEPNRCPAGTERRVGEVWAIDWWCARGDVRHGPFAHTGFDERDRTHYEVSGEYLDDALHGLVDSKGIYGILGSNHERVFRCEVYDHGRLIRSNEASVNAVLTADAPEVTRRFAVKAAGLSQVADWSGDPQIIGAFDIEASGTWTDAPGGTPPSVLRVELATPFPERPRPADGLLYPIDEPELPTTASDLPLGHVPTISAPWLTCDPEGCEHELVVTLRWLSPGPGRLEAYVVARAVPYRWPEAAPIELRAIDP